MSNIFIREAAKKIFFSGRTNKRGRGVKSGTLIKRAFKKLVAPPMNTYFTILSNYVVAWQSLGF